jgi:pentatricopeptide repeat protein
MYDKCGTIEQAWFIFNKMVETNILPWSAMIRNFALNALLKKALALFFQLKRETFAPDHYAMIRVFSACGRLGVAGLGD